MLDASESFVPTLSPSRMSFVAAMLAVDLILEGLTDRLAALVMTMEFAVPLMGPTGARDEDYEMAPAARVGDTDKAVLSLSKVQVKLDVGAQGRYLGGSLP